MKGSALLFTLVAGAALLAFACGPKSEPPAAQQTAPAASEPAAPAAAAATATVTLQSAEGKNVSGSLVFTQEGDKVHVVANLAGVSPAGLHGIHLHEKGDCSAPDFSSAGGHFNPANAPHGCPGDDIRHAGDFGNIEIHPDGTGALDITTDLITLDDGPKSALGKAVILHEGQDDCTTQPSGNSGARIACGVVEEAGDTGDEDHAATGGGAGTGGSGDKGSGY
jgi:superoxide dismutase, Cu-Zn family